MSSQAAAPRPAPMCAVRLGGTVVTYLPDGAHEAPAAELYAGTPDPVMERHLAAPWGTAAADDELR